MKKLIWVVILSALGSAGAYGFNAYKVKFRTDKVADRVERVMTSIAKGDADKGGYAFLGTMDLPPERAGNIVLGWISETPIEAAIGPGFSWEILEVEQDMEARIATVHLRIKDGEHRLMVPWDGRMYFED